MIDMPGVSAINLVLGLYSYKPSTKVADAATKLQTKSILATGAHGKQLLSDIDIYIAGMNAEFKKYSPSTKPMTRTGIYALNAIKGQFLGEGGGAEVPNADFLARLQKKFGTKKGIGIYDDLRGRNDPETAVTTTKKFDYQTKVDPGHARGLVRLKAGSFKFGGVKLPAASAAASTTRSAREGSRGPHQLASNIMIASGKASETGSPLFVGGPQIGFNYPGLTLEMQLKGPHINVRGATSAPYPGYMLIGRGENFAWSLTSAGADIIDTYAETLCGGSKKKYLYKGRCRKMETVKAGSITKGGKTTSATFLRTVHGPVLGYAKNASGKVVALSQKRSSFGKDTVDQEFNQQLTYGRVHSAKEFVSAVKLTPQTFNSFYASDKESAFYTSGELPLRPKHVDPTLPTDGRGKFEWKGTLKASKHPQVINPSTGYIVNWNNKPAAGFPAGDDRFGNEGGIQRVKLLQDELARHSKQTLATVLSAANAAATEDVREVELWPTLKAMLDKGKSPSSLATQAVAQLQAWHDAGGSRVDANLDGKIDNPGVPILDGAWTGIAKAGLCDRLGSSVCKALRNERGMYDDPPGGQYGGWHQYMWKDLRTELGHKVKGKYSTTYCGAGSAKRCAKELWAAINSSAKKLQASQGADMSKWSKPTSSAEITFSPLALITMQYTNKPSGIHQVMQFGP